MAFPMKKARKILKFKRWDLTDTIGCYIWATCIRSTRWLRTNYELFQPTLQQLKRFGIDITSTNLEFKFKSIILALIQNYLISIQHFKTQLKISHI